MQKVDVLLSTWNGAKYVREQLESLGAQEAVDLHVHVRDDGSSDETLAIVQDFSSLHPGFLTIHDDIPGNLGVIGSFEVLLGKASAPYIAFADQDDVWLPGKLQHALEVLAPLSQNGREPCLVYGDLQVVDANLELLHPSFFGRSGIDPRRGLDGTQLTVQNCVVGCTAVFTKTLRDIALPFPTTCLMHDWWLALCACNYGATAIVPQTDILYRQHGNNAVGSQTLAQALTRYRKRRTTTFDSIAQAMSLLGCASELPGKLNEFLGELAPASRRQWKRLLWKAGVHKSGVLRDLFFYLVER